MTSVDIVGEGWGVWSLTVSFLGEDAGMVLESVMGEHYPRNRDPIHRASSFTPAWFLSGTHKVVTGDPSAERWASYHRIKRVRRLKLRILRNVDVFVPDILEWMQRSLLPCCTVWIVFAWYLFPWMSSVNYIYSSGVFLYNGTISFHLPLYLPRYSPSSLNERRKKGREWELNLGRMSTGSWAHLEKPDILLRFPGLPGTHRM